MVDEDEEKALDKIVEKLAECSRLYIKTTPELIERLKPLFKIHEELMNERVLQHSFFLYYFSNMKK